MMHFSWKKEKGNYQFESLSNFQLKKIYIFLIFFLQYQPFTSLFDQNNTLKLKINEVKPPSNNQN